MLQYAILAAIFVLMASTVYIVCEERRFRRESLPRAGLGTFWDGKERRKHLRCEKCCGAQYLVSPCPDRRVSTRSENISFGGVKLVLEELLPKGTALTVDITVSDEEKPITANGKIAWIREIEPEAAEERGKRIFEAGVEFINMTLENEKRLRDHVDEIVQTCPSAVL